MNIQSLEVAGFRAFGERYEFDLDSRAIILVGDNGTGKTSFFDAIFWALCGALPRLGNRADVVSRWSPTGEASVTLRLSADDGTLINITRTTDGKDMRVLIVNDQGEFRDGAAIQQLVRLMWNDAGLIADPMEALAGALATSVYLQQDRVRQFVEAESDHDRFLAVSELLGVGRVSELQAQLDRARTAWSKATNQLRTEREEVSVRLTDLQTRLAYAPPAVADAGSLAADWMGIVVRAAKAGLPVDLIPKEPTSSAVEALSRQIRARLASHARRQETWAGMSADVLALGSEPKLPDLASLVARVQSLSAGTEAIRSALAAAQAAAAEVRRSQLEIAEQKEELRVLLRLAMRHLADTCPVCGQPIDQHATLHRLQVASHDSGSSAPGPSAGGDPVVNLAAQLQEAETQLIQARAELSSAEAAARARSVREAELRERAAALGVGGVPSSDQIQDALTRESQASEALRDLTSEVEAFALRGALSGESVRRRDLEREAATLQRKLESVDANLLERERTGFLASQMIDGLRDSSSDLVAAHLEQLEPLVQRIWGRIDPHPVFKAVRLASWMRGGRGRLAPEISDPATEVVSTTPADLLSSSQTNALALTIFAALNLGLPRRPIESILFDDPLQSLDDVNLLGLVDLLRRIRGRRQLFVSTHDNRFGQLLGRKLRPVDDDAPTIIYRFAEWRRRGPVVSKATVPADRAPYRLVSQSA